MTDQQIISLFQARDERAVRETAQRYSSMILRTALRYVRSTEDAEECVSDVMLELWQKIPPLEPNNLEALIVTLTQRKALDRVRHAAADKRGGQMQAVALEDVTAATPDNVEDTVHQHALTEAVERFLDTLSDDAQTIFVERFHNETKPSEIARKFGLSGVHVRKSLMQTRKKLRQYLKEEGLL